MSHYGGDDDTWDSATNAPTASQLAEIEELCEELGYDNRCIMPDDFEEASDMIDDMREELGWDG